MIVHRHANLADRHGAGCGCVPSGLTRRGALRFGLTHRDCGAAKIALGEPAVANLDAETKSHAEMLVLFRQEVAKRQPKLNAVTGIMALDGSVLLIDDKGLPTPG
jgi:hypothetical protein